MSALLTMRRDWHSHWLRNSRWACTAASAGVALLVLLACFNWPTPSTEEPVNRLWAWTTHMNMSSPTVSALAGIQGVLQANSTKRHTAEQYEVLSRLRQEVFCRDAHPLRLQDTKVVKISDTVNMHLLANKDLVSKALIEGGVWEEDDLKAILWALQQPLPDGHQQYSNNTLFVDIGANVGAFTIRIAAAGYKVFAFEGMRDNQLLLRSTLCESDPVIMSRVTLFPYGAGAAPQACVLVAHEANLGDGITICDGRDLSEEKSKGYIFRSRMDILPLDWVIQRDVKVMKIDVEGFEPFVMQGAKKLFTEHRVWFIVVEFNVLTLNGQLAGTTIKPADFVFDLKRLGYAVSSKSFQGPWLTDSEIEAMGSQTQPSASNLYLVHPLLLPQIPVHIRRLGH